MSRFQKIAARLKDYDLDALLILSEPNRLYATGFHSTAGAVLVTPEESYFFTDGRYIEAARRQVTEGVVEENTRQRNTDQLLTEALQRHNVRRLGYEDTRTTVAEYRRLGGKLPAELVPAKDLLENLRASKEPCEIAEMVKAQRIAEAALSDPPRPDGAGDRRLFAVPDAAAGGGEDVLRPHCRQRRQQQYAPRGAL